MVWTKWLSDPSAVATVKQVCKAWHDHAVQAYAGTVKLDAFGSVQALATFRSAKNLDCRDVQWLTNDDLRRLPEVMLSLRGIDISGCTEKSELRQLLEERQQQPPRLGEQGAGWFVGGGGRSGRLELHPRQPRLDGLAVQLGGEFLRGRAEPTYEKTGAGALVDMGATRRRARRALGARSWRGTSSGLDGIYDTN